jgi:hypothetical protein
LYINPVQDQYDHDAAIKTHVQPYSERLRFGRLNFSQIFKLTLQPRLKCELSLAVFTDFSSYRFLPFQPTDPSPSPSDGWPPEKSTGHITHHTNPRIFFADPISSVSRWVYPISLLVFFLFFTH